MGDSVNVDDEVPADPHEIFLGQFEQEVLQAGLDIVLPLPHVNGAVLPFHFDEPDVIEVYAAKFVAHFGEEVLSPSSIGCKFLESGCHGGLQSFGVGLDFSVGRHHFPIEHLQFVLHL